MVCELYLNNAIEYLIYAEVFLQHHLKAGVVMVAETSSHLAKSSEAGSLLCPQWQRRALHVQREPNQVRVQGPCVAWGINNQVLIQPNRNCLRKKNVSVCTWMA